MPPTTCPALRDRIQGLLAEGQSHARRATAWERVETCWYFGDALLSHIWQQPRADYGEEGIDNLSKDISLSRSLLFATPRFRRLLPIVPARGQLSWAH